MDVTAVASAMAGAQVGRTQLALAAKNLGQRANVAAGLGQNLDVSV